MTPVEDWLMAHDTELAGVIALFVTFGRNMGVSSKENKRIKIDFSRSAVITAYEMDKDIILTAHRARQLLTELEAGVLILEARAKEKEAERE